MENVWLMIQLRMFRGLVNWSLVLAKVDIQDSGDILGGESSPAKGAGNTWGQVPPPMWLLWVHQAVGGALVPGP